jgi:polyphosphate kinase
MNSTLVPLYFNRDLSWLSFNARVLWQAADPVVPLYERIRFLAIFSSNLDEFFRVRMPSLMAINQLTDTPSEEADQTLLPTVQHTINQCQETFGRLLTDQILPDLLQHGIHLYYKEYLLPEHKAEVTEYFFSRVLCFLQPVWLDSHKINRVHLPDNALYFVVVVSSPDTPGLVQYALLNIPRAYLPRFLVLPPTNNLQHILFLDDIIREKLPVIFTGYLIHGCYSVKMNQNADVSMADEFSGEMDEKIARMLEAREIGLPTRLLYDATAPEALRAFLAEYFCLSHHEMVGGGRYHNLRDLSSLPEVAGNRLNYPPRPPLSHPDLQHDRSIFSTIEEQDQLLHMPYQSYNYILRYFNEAAIDPDVEAIYVTLYRVAPESYIVNALISAVKNGKQVVVFVELKARFDEANNLKWGKKMKAAGINIVYSIPSLKVHAKTALVKRKRGSQSQYYGLLATGNFNEGTARFYTDHVLLTCHSGMTRELSQLFDYLQSRQLPANYCLGSFEYLLVSQFNLVPRFLALIDREIAHRQAGRTGRIIIKLNNLQEHTMINKLYQASQAGVQVELIVRGICCLIPGVPGLSEHITVRRLVDRYLEHARVFIFHNDGAIETYLGSADWMNRNLHHRIEVCFPVYHPRLQAEIRHIIDLQLADNQHACWIDQHMEMVRVRTPGKSIQAQEAIYAYLKDQL